MKKRLMIAFLLIFAILLTSCGKYDEVGSKYTYVFDFDLDNKQIDTAAKTNDGEIAYIVSDNKGNVFEQIYAGDDIVFELIKDKDGNVLYTSETKYYQYDEENKYAFSTSKAYYYEDGLLVKEMANYSVSNLTKLLAQREQFESDSAASSTNQNFFERIWNSIVSFFGGGYGQQVDILSISDISPNYEYHEYEKVEEGEGLENTVIGYWPSTVLTFDGDFTPGYLFHSNPEINLSADYDFLPQDVYLPYLDTYYSWYYDFITQLYNAAVYFSSGQFELDYEYKDGVRYISRVTYSHDNTKGTGAFTYNDDGTCLFEYSSVGANNTGAVSEILSRTDVTVITYKDNKTRRGITPAEIPEYTLSKSFEATFKYEINGGICTVTDKPLQKKSYSRYGYYDYKVSIYDSDNNVTECAEYGNGDELLQITYYEYNNGHTVKESTYSDRSRTTIIKNIERIYDTEYPDLILKYQETEYENNSASKITTTEYRILQNEDNRYSEEILTTKYYDENGTLIKKTVLDSDNTKHTYEFDGTGYSYLVKNQNNEILTEEYIEGNIPD